MIKGTQNICDSRQEKRELWMKIFNVHYKRSAKALKDETRNGEICTFMNQDTHLEKHLFLFFLFDGITFFKKETCSSAKFIQNMESCKSDSYNKQGREVSRPVIYTA